MIKSIKAYFESLLENDKQNEHPHANTIELATAVLMIEISLADDHIDDNERETIKKLLTRSFSLDEAEIDELINAAEQEVDHAVSLYEFTRLLNDSLDIDEKTRVVQNLWRVAFADSVLDKYEEYYIRKVADLLYVPHSNYIKAKHDAAG